MYGAMSCAAGMPTEAETNRRADNPGRTVPLAEFDGGPDRATAIRPDPSPSPATPRLRSLASGKTVTQFSLATNGYAGAGKERAEYHNIVTWV